MPFEPLKTDEKYEGPAQAKTNLERQLMAGCTTIVVICFLVYFITIWPWFALPAYTVSGLTEALIFGAGASVILGIIATLKFKSAGGAGFLGGAMAASVFMYLRLNQIMLGKGHVDLPQPEYPERWEWLVPLAYMVLCIAVVAVLWPKEEDDYPAAPENSQQSK